MKRVLSVLLALCLLAGALPMFTSAADSDFITDEYGSVKYIGPGGDVVVPNGVTNIAGSMFSETPNADKIISLTFPSSVKGISPHAFDDCTSLSSVKLPVSITYIAAYVFENIKDVYYDGTVEQWRKIASEFYYCDELLMSGKLHLNGAGDDLTVGDFTDVKSSDYYAEAVVWAANTGITNGIGNGKFGPSQACKREQIVTFLWNSTGKPEPGSIADFKDMPKNETYQKAISWAAENSITSGYAGNIFRPSKTCTRAEAMTFIWRAHNCPEPSSMASFTDMPDIPDFQKAISWASENGILAGDGKGHCMPNKNCTRAEIVSFLYRAKNL